MVKKKISKLIILFLVFSFLLFLPISSDNAEGAWWDTDWQYWVVITVPDYNINGHLYDFPVPIIINSTVATNCNSDGSDIRFLLTDNSTQLDYEIERWDSSSNSIVWVKVPHLAPDADNDIIMYYGNPSATDAQNPTGVWSNNFTAVWHFNESSGTIYDSTSNNYDLTNNGATYIKNADGLGGAYSFDGINDYLQVTGFNPNNKGTISFITVRGCSGCGRRRFCGAVDEFEAVVRGDNLLTNHLFVKGAGILSGSPLTDTTNFHHLMFTWNYSDNLNLIYDNGIFDASGYLADDDPGTSLTFQIAHSTWYAGEYYNGTIDEFRIASINRSINWTEAEYLSTTDPHNFTLWRTHFSQADVPPYQYNEIPVDDGSSDTLPNLFITVGDDFNRTLDVYFYSNVSGSWQLFGSNLSVNSTGDVILQQYNANFTDYNTTYWWTVNVTNGNAWSNATYNFTTSLGHIPDVYDETPPDGSTNNYLPISLGVRVADNDSHWMDIEFYTNESGTWTQIGSTITGVYNGTYYVYAPQFTQYNTTYWWKVKVTDQLGLTNTTVYATSFNFTTAVRPKTDKICDGMNCCGDIDVFSYFGIFGIFSIIAIFLALKKHNNNDDT